MQRVPVFLIFGLLLVTALTFAAGAQGEPRRVVSMNLCTDELLLAVADAAQIRSVSWLVQDPENSFSAEAAAGIESNHGLAEEIVLMAPDLVITGAFTTPATAALLQQLGVPVLKFDIPTRLEQVYAQIGTLARALGRQAHGRRLISAMQAQLKRLEARPKISGARPLAAVYHPNGFTTGRDSLIHELLELAGFDNLGAEGRSDGYGFLSVEELVWRQPDLLILNRARRASPSLAHQLLEHPALEHLTTVSVPPQSWSCGGPALVDAMKILQRAYATGSALASEGA